MLMFADHAFILGSTNESAKPLADLLYQMDVSGAGSAEINEAEKKWTSENTLVTYVQGETI